MNPSGPKKTALLNMTVMVILFLFLINILYCLLRFEYGHGYSTIFFGPGDPFADLVKVAMSYKDIMRGVEGSAYFSKWPDIYKNYLLDNPYGGVDALQKGALTHFHLPPFSSIIFILCAFVIKWLQYPVSAVVLYYMIYLAIVLYAINRYVELLDGRSVRQWGWTEIVIVLIFMISFPAIYMTVRGNINAGFTAAFIAIYLLPISIRKPVGYVECIAIAMAINIRPNAAILLLALPSIYGVRQSVLPLLKSVILTIILFCASLYLVGIIYPDYTFQSFLKALKIYDNIYIKNAEGDSLHLFLVNICKYYGFRFRYDTIKGALLFLVSISPLIIPLAIYLSKRFDRDVYVLPFAFVVFYRIYTPVFTEYHMLVFAVIICIVLEDYRERKGGDLFIYYFILIVSIIMISPKRYFFDFVGVTRIFMINIETMMAYISLFIVLMYYNVIGEKCGKLVGREYDVQKV